MEGIKNIIFDLGGVIINLDNKRTEDAFVTLGAKNFSQFFGHGFAASFFKEYELGKISDQEFTQNLREMGNLKVPDQEIIKAWNALLLDFPEQRVELIKELRKSYRIFLFSNTNRLHMKRVRKIFQDTFPGDVLERLFEKAYYSHTLGLRKPDIASFRYILEQNKLKGEETMFVDDALINVEGANAAGLKGFYLSPGKTILDMDWT
ncbi:MAG TPA: HAD family phosphatase [Puia sp.]|jgi:HAD superfamily hydrolase (TIGR01509 family)|nr:HAD family phosphatase [Puia sp.]